MSKTPKYDEVKCRWTGWETNTLYAIVDPLIGKTLVRPGFDMRGIGPNVTVRVATRAEAEELWQSPLHPGWKVEG